MVLIFAMKVKILIETTLTISLSMQEQKLPHFSMQERKRLILSKNNIINARTKQPSYPSKSKRDESYQTQSINVQEETNH